MPKKDAAKPHKLDNKHAIQPAPHDDCGSGTIHELFPGTVP